MKRIVSIFSLLLVLVLSFSGCALVDSEPQAPISLDEVPAFDGETAYVNINGGVPFFTEDEMTMKSYESYSELDSLGRCGVAMSCIGFDIMPTEDRGSISNVKPSGWQTVKYDIVDAKYLYNRCHLIGFQLTGENANKGNLITGTRFLNIEGMLIFENMVADYLKEEHDAGRDSHVMYRVTPIFEGSNLVASGVLIEAKSVEDDGEAIQFCVYSYNAQPGITIDYRNGDSKLDDGTEFPEAPEQTPEENPDNSGEGVGDEKTYVINKSTGKVHTEDCRYASSKNTETYTGSLDDVLSDGDYSACGTCKPE